MSLKPIPIGQIPQETARLAKAVFPEGSTFIKMRDDTADAVSRCNVRHPVSQSGAASTGCLEISPGHLHAIRLVDCPIVKRPMPSALVWIGSMRLRLELEERGFDFSVLCEFRSRLIEGNAEYLLFETMLNLLKQRGLIKARGRPRTDATHVLAAVRAINRVVCVGETMRAALGSLAELAPEWLGSFVPDEWYERYAHRVEKYRLPKEQTKRTALVETIGADGYAMLDAIDTTPELSWLHHVPALETVRRVWVQQFELIEDKPHLRANDNIPPPAKMICSPVRCGGHLWAQTDHVVGGIQGASDRKL